jgi:hypothetical protein
MIIASTAVFMISCTSQTDENPILNQIENLESGLDSTYLPFEMYFEGRDFDIMVYVEEDSLFNIYEPIFAKHGYSGNGYSWEGLIEQIIKKLNPELLNHIMFDSEAGAFFAIADSRESQIRFGKLLQPIFSDLSILEKYIQEADRSKIFD